MKMTTRQRLTATALPCGIAGTAGVAAGAVLFAKFLKKEQREGWEYDAGSGIFTNDETGEAKVVLPA